MSEHRVVLDTSAYLALVHREVGFERVAELLSDSDYGVMSAVNVAEVVSKQVGLGVPAEDALSLLYLTGIQIENFGPEEAIKTGSLRPLKQQFGLSLGDRACLALGLKLECPVLTADRLWDKVDLGLTIHQIR